MYTFFTQFFTMEGQKLRDSIALFYKLNSEKGKSYTYSHYKEFDMEPIIRMFENLKFKIRKADEQGLRSINKI